MQTTWPISLPTGCTGEMIAVKVLPLNLNGLSVFTNSSISINEIVCGTWKVLKHCHVVVIE